MKKYVLFCLILPVLLCSCVRNDQFTEREDGESEITIESLDGIDPITAPNVITDDQLDIAIKSHFEDLKKEIKQWMNEHLDHIKYEITMEDIVDMEFNKRTNERLKEFEDQIMRIVEEKISNEKEKSDEALIQVSQRVTAHFDTYVKDSVIDPLFKKAIDEIRNENAEFRKSCKEEMDRAIASAISDLSMSITNEINAAKELEAEKKVKYELKIAVDEIRKSCEESTKLIISDTIDGYALKNKNEMLKFAAALKRCEELEKRILNLENGISKQSGNDKKE